LEGAVPEVFDALKTCALLGPVGISVLGIDSNAFEVETLEGVVEGAVPEVFDALETCVLLGLGISVLGIDSNAFEAER
jgi:hypothetical protein